MRRSGPVAEALLADRATRKQRGAGEPCGDLYNQQTLK